MLKSDLFYTASRALGTIAKALPKSARLRSGVKTFEKLVRVRLAREGFSERVREFPAYSRGWRGWVGFWNPGSWKTIVFLCRVSRTRIGLCESPGGLLHQVQGKDA
jgi:hypothetical protein